MTCFLRPDQVREEGNMANWGFMTIVWTLRHHVVIPGSYNTGHVDNRFYTACTLSIEGRLTNLIHQLLRDE